MGLALPLQGLVQSEQASGLAHAQAPPPEEHHGLRVPPVGRHALPEGYGGRRIAAVAFQGGVQRRGVLTLQQQDLGFQRSAEARVGPVHALQGPPGLLREAQPDVAHRHHGGYGAVAHVPVESVQGVGRLSIRTVHELEGGVLRQTDGFPDPSAHYQVPQPLTGRQAVVRAPVGGEAVPSPQLILSCTVQEPLRHILPDGHEPAGIYRQEGMVPTVGELRHMHAPVQDHHASQEVPVPPVQRIERVRAAVVQVLREDVLHIQSLWFAEAPHQALAFVQSPTCEVVHLPQRGANRCGVHRCLTR